MSFKLSFLSEMFFYDVILVKIHVIYEGLNTLKDFVDTFGVCRKTARKSILSLFVNVALGLASETANLIREAWRS